VAVTIVEGGAEQGGDGVIERRLGDLLIGPAAVIQHRGQAVPLGEPARICVMPYLVRRLEERRRDGVQQHQRGERGEQEQ
jgi:hypothetical protein